MEHIETNDIKGVETTVEQHQKNGSSETVWTLIGAIEQIVTLAIELKLEAPFFEKAHSALAYVSERMSLSEEQSLAFALFVEKSGKSQIQISDLAEMVNCRTVRLISMMTSFDVLVQRHLIRRVNKESSIVYSVPMSVVDAVRHNKSYQFPSIEHLTSDGFFERMGKIFIDEQENSDRLLEDLDALVAANPELPFCRTLQSYSLSDKKIERLLFYIFCNLYVNKNDDRVGSYDWSSYFTWDEQHLIGFLLSTSELVLIERNIIEPCNSDQQSDFYHLTSTAKECLFVGRQYVNKQVSTRKDLISHTTIAFKELFYNPTEQQQIDRLGELLSPEHFADIQKRLETSGLHKGFTCLFYGASGTGKTETVRQLARRTERDLMVVDMLHLKDCCGDGVGKNIKTVFDRYRSYVRQMERVPILLLNGADVLMNTQQNMVYRANVNEENSIQNIFIQEMEKLDGILIVATNLTGNFDRAVEWRFICKVEFERPFTETKSRIWMSMIPTLDQQAATALAERYDFNGGQIENIARKWTVDMILRGEEPSFEQLDAYCRSDMLWRRIGF